MRKVSCSRSAPKTGIGSSSGWFPFFQPMRAVVSEGNYRFTRRQVRDHTGWGNTQLKIHMARLEDLEFLAIHRGGRGQSFVYELLYDGAGPGGAPFLPGLIDPDELASSTATTPNRSGANGHWSGHSGEKSPPGRPQVGGWSALGEATPRERKRPIRRENAEIRKHPLSPPAAAVLAEADS